MNTRRGVELVAVLGPERHQRHVEDEVTDLPEELVLVDVPIGSIATWNVGVTIDQSYACKICRATNGRPRIGITNELSEVVSVSRIRRH